MSFRIVTAVLILLALVGCVRPQAVPLPEAQSVSSEEIGTAEEGVQRVTDTPPPTIGQRATHPPSPPTEISVTPATGQPYPTATPAFPSSTLPGDSGGPQPKLSEVEEAVQAIGSGSYAGQRCRVAVDTFTCDCVPDSMVARFTFPDPNHLHWELTTSTGSQTYDLTRQGVNTWVGVGPAVDDIVIHIQLIFTATGFQHIVTVAFPTGESPTCTMNWTRQ